MTITYAQLAEAVAGGAVGIRWKTRLAPLGGPGDKISPPTYGEDPGMETRYAVETRRVEDGNGGATVQAVVLDSVASQANRFEIALLAAARRGDIPLPVTSVDFTSFDGLEGFGRISDLEAPHRIFDAILRDSFDGEVLFRFGPVGRAVTEATPRNAAALLHHCPPVLLFGGWDSTGPKGGRGAKYERAITSEIVALDIELGVRTSSRIDPLGTEIRAAKIYEAADGGWTLDPSEARTEKGKPVEARPSEINHGNVRPSIDRKAGGVTAGRIEATTVLSFVQLRRLGFPTGPDGSPLAEAARAGAETAARTSLAALGLAATALAFEEGFDLRSRCVLVADGPLRPELVARTGEATDLGELAASDAVALLTEAVARSAEAGLPWRAREHTLRPSDQLAELVRRSLAHAVPESD